MLSAQTVDRYYRQAIDVILQLQKNYDSSCCRLPDFDRSTLLAELELFRDWFCHRHCQLVLTRSMQRCLDKATECLLATILAGPRVAVHRDFHSKNLMLLPDGRLGVLDFQDAVIGPASYDLVSLIRDRYLTWPRAQELEWVEYYFNSAQSMGVLTASDSFSEFVRQFDFSGIQRHVMWVGIFALTSIMENLSILIIFRVFCTTFIQQARLMPSCKIFRV